MQPPKVRLPLIALTLLPRRPVGVSSAKFVRPREILSDAFSTADELHLSATSGDAVTRNISGARCVGPWLIRYLFRGAPPLHLSRWLAGWRVSIAAGQHVVSERAIVARRHVGAVYCRRRRFSSAEAIAGRRAIGLPSQRFGFHFATSIALISA